MESTGTIQGKESIMSELDDVGNGAADPLKVRDFWLDVVRPAADKGKLDKIPTIKARTPREAAQAQTQNHWLTRKTFGGFGENYNRIKWKKAGGAA